MPRKKAAAAAPAAPSIITRTSTPERVENLSEGLTGTFRLNWNPSLGTEIALPDLAVGNLPALTRYQNVIIPKIVNEAYAHDLLNQKQYADFSPFGLVEAEDEEAPDPEKASKVWIHPDFDMEDFGVPYLRWTYMEPRPYLMASGTRVEGKWMLRLSGIERDNVAVVGTAAWNDTTALNDLASRCGDSELLLVTLGLTNSEDLRAESARWTQEQAAKALATTIEKTAHTPYTKIARILREARIQNRIGGGRPRVTAISLPKSKIVPALMVHIPSDQGRDEHMRVLQGAGLTHIPLDTSDIPNAQYFYTDRYQVWAKDPTVFTEGSVELQKWLTAKTIRLSRAWKNKQSMLV